MIRMHMLQRPPMDQSALSLPEVDQSADTTIQEHAYARLRAAIMVGALPPGQKLTIRGLAQQLALSQTPIREAVRRLSSESAIEVLGNRRLRVPEMTSGRFDELVRLRAVLELHAAVRSLPYVSEIVIDRMETLDAQLDALMQAGDAAGLMQLNHDFHRLLYRLNPDQAVMPLVESVWLQLGPFQRQLMARPQHHYSIDRHKEILAALRRRDADALKAALSADIHEGLTLAGQEVLSQKARSD